MIDYSNYKLIHRHGNDWVELKPGAHHEVAELDPERTWMHGAHLFRCTGCDEEVMIVPDPGNEGISPAV